MARGDGTPRGGEYREAPVNRGGSIGGDGLPKEGGGPMRDECRRGKSADEGPGCQGGKSTGGGAHFRRGPSPMRTSAKRKEAPGGTSFRGG
ncbi:hypothetical protein PBY51_001172 [Eleginops maclovinus]|uniref:Uncharacterized protein n=1 Tax=Eleginops maclovinus TaxID=56733 RepID=A0AAN7XNJ5_ELEMC|nr:hypothetical protein PBY51_001172 [Eleginops maclovinus]